METQVYRDEANRILNIIEQFSKSNNFKCHSISNTKNSMRYLSYGISDSYAHIKYNDDQKITGFNLYIEDIPIREKLTHLVHEYGHVLDIYHNLKRIRFGVDGNIIAEEVRAWIYGIKLLSNIQLFDKKSFYKSIMSYIWDYSDSIPFSEEWKYNNFIDCVLFNGNLNKFNPSMFLNH